MQWRRLYRTWCKGSLQWYSRSQGNSFVHQGCSLLKWRSICAHWKSSHCNCFGSWCSKCLAVGLGRSFHKVCGNLVDLLSSSRQWNALEIFFSEKRILTVSYIKPLLGFPIVNVHVLELVLHIRFPSNIGIIDGDVAWSCHCLFAIELEGIIEETFGNKAAWESWLTWDELCPFISYFLDWISEL